MKKNLKVAIVGAGASGLVAAVFAARDGAEVTIFEKHQQAGRKILATGNGRCNISNTDLDMSHFHGQNPEFAKYAIDEFGFHKCKEFFEEIGLEYKIASNGRSYPLSLQSSSVVDLLKYELESLGVTIIYKADIAKIDKIKDGFCIIGNSSRRYYSDKVLIASGGRAAPGLSSDGDGYEFAKSFGHTVTTTFPSLVQLKLEADFLKQISGVKIEGSIELQYDKCCLQKKHGDILFADYGISGSAVLDISREAGIALMQKKDVIVSIDMFPDFQKHELDELLKKRFDSRPKKNLQASLVGFVNKKLGFVVTQLCSIQNDINVANLSKKDRKNIVELMKNWQFKVTGTQDWKRAEVTSGGVDVNDVNPKTLESRLQKGVFFAGEVLDVDGDCGGYNLHWAWASGYIAGVNISVHS